MHARCLPSLIDKPQTPIREKQSVYVLFCAFKMFKMIECPADCQIRSVIRFLKKCEVYGENAMSDGMVRKRLQSSMKVVITCMTSHEAAGRLIVSGCHVLRGRDTDTCIPL